MGLDLLEDSSMFLSYKTVVDQRLASNGLCVRISAQLFGSQVGDLDVAIVCESHDQTFTLLKLSTRHEHRWYLGLGRPNEPNILVNHQEVVEAAEHGHETRCLQFDFVLNLCLQLLPRALIVLIEVGPILWQVIGKQAGWSVVESTLVPDLSLVCQHENGLLTGDYDFHGVGHVSILMRHHLHWLFA